MTQPLVYNRLASFSNIQAQAPADPLPGNTVDAELNAVKVTLDQILANIALIQRDDGELANQSVGRDQITPEIEVGFNPPQVWVTGTVYAANSDVVFHGSGYYRCEIAHTAGTFATDLTAGKWELIFDLSGIVLADASQIVNSPAGSISATNVQAAINELATEKAALSHTHPASAISDSTAAGRNLLKAADVPAQRDLLGLGALALLDDVVVTNISDELAFTGIISPAALGGATNDWTPTGLHTATTVRASASTPIRLTGIDAPSVDGTLLFLQNVGDNPITLTAQDTGSVAFNRFLFSKDIVLQPSDGITLLYDATSHRWRTQARNGTLPRSYLAGFNLSNNGADATNDINISRGEARDSTNSVDLVVVSNFTKQLDNTFAAGTGNGMNASGIGLAANCTRHIHVIGKIDGTTDFLASDSIDATATLPTGYVYWRRIGSIMRRSSAIVAFTQAGDWFYLDTPVLDLDDANPTTAALATITVPEGLALDVRANAFLSSTNNEVWMYAYPPTSTADNPSDTASPLSSLGVFFNTGVANTTKIAGQIDARTNTAAQIKIDGKGTGTMERRIATVAWRDRRGRDD